MSNEISNLTEYTGMFVDSRAVRDAIENMEERAALERDMDRKTAKWNPVEKPYRVSRTYRNPYGKAACGNGHHSRIATYATIDEARADVAADSSGKPMIHFAENAEDWCRRGKWRHVH